MNELTRRARSLITTNDPENINKLTTLIEVSKTLEKAGLADLALDLNAFDLEGTFRCTRLIDVAINSKNMEAFKLLLTYLHESEAIPEETKKKIYASSLCNSISENQMSFFNELLEFHLYGVDNLIKDYSHTTTSNYSDSAGKKIILKADHPLKVAVQKNNDSCAMILLLYGADPTINDMHKTSALFIAKNFNPAMVPQLQAAIYLKEARQAFEQEDAAALMAKLSSACELDSVFVRCYILNMTRLAIKQQNLKNDDTTDYRFLLEFIRAFVCILRSPLNKNQKYPGFQELQQKVLEHLLAYNADDTVEDVQKLFSSNAEKMKFITEPLQSSLISGAACENSAKIMVGKEKEQVESSDNPSKEVKEPSDVSLMITTQKQSGLLKNPQDKQLRDESKISLTL